MAYLPTALTPEQVKATSVSNIRPAYNKLAETYNKIVDGDLIFCPKCNTFNSRVNYYSDKRYATGLFPKCKTCILEEVEQRKRKGDKPNESKLSVQKMLQEMDLPYLDDLYENQCKIVADEVNEKNRKSPFLAYLVPVKSLPQYSSLHWEDSQFAPDDEENPEFEIKENKRTIKAGKKRFGEFYSNQDIMFLENEYQDWVSRYECNTKAQESIFERLACKKLEINKATKAGDNTKDLDRTYQDLLNTANITPRQQVVDPTSNAQTLGTLIQRWEETRPLPEIDPELRDVNKIGLYIDVFFKGHISKTLGLKNRFSNIYESYMKKYTVERPEYDEDEDSELIFDKIFGSLEED